MGRKSEGEKKQRLPRVGKKKGRVKRGSIKGQAATKKKTEIPHHAKGGEPGRRNGRGGQRASLEGTANGGTSWLLTQEEGMRKEIGGGPQATTSGTSKTVVVPGETVNSQLAGGDTKRKT